MGTVVSHLHSQYVAYFDTTILLPTMENTVAYLFEDDRTIVYICIVRDGQCYRMEKRIHSKQIQTDKNDNSFVLSQEDNVFIEDHHSLKERLWNLYVQYFDNASSIRIKMRYHTLSGSGSYQLDLRGNTFENFKGYLNNDTYTIQNLIDFKRYQTMYKT